MSEMNKFVENFEEAFEKSGQSIDEKAKEVIEAVAEYGKRAMAGEAVVNYFFADHGWEHSCRLSKYATFIIKRLKEDCVKKFDKVTWNNMLVLLWTSIALHDIGMNDISKEKKEIGEIIKEQAGRIEHVKKSGEWISRLIEYIEGKCEMDVENDVNDFVKKWEIYWHDDQRIDTITALRIVKDIVLMHGENENWLMPVKIGALERNIIFSDIDESDRDIYTRMIRYDEAILCLSDLLDICPERMFIFSNRDLNKYYDELDETKKQITFEHWVSHNITTVDNKDYDKEGYFKLNMHLYSMDTDMYLKNTLYNTYPHLGAVEMCLKWGNKKQLLDILKDFGYKGIKQCFCKQKVNTWKKINDMAKKLNLFKKMQISNINSELGGTSNIFVNELVCRWIEKNWYVEKDISFYHEFRSIFHLFQKGACLHLLYDKNSSQVLSGPVGYYVSLQGEEETGRDVNDILLIAIGTFFEICNQRNDIEKIEIISKGSDKFSSLYKGIGAGKRTAYIIIIKNYFEDNLNKIVETIKNKNDSSFVIFVSMEHSLNHIINKDCQEIEYRVNNDKFGKIKPLLNEYALSHWANKDEANDREKEQVEELLAVKQTGVGKYLKHLKVIYNGIQAIGETIITELENNQYSSLFILNLFEMMSENSNEGKAVKREELSYFYEEFYAQNRSKILKIKDFESAIHILLELCEENGGKIKLSEKYSDSFDNLIINSSKEVSHSTKRNLFQMMIFFWLYNYRKVNFKSLCYREYLTYLSPEQLCIYILNTNIALTERINISFETSEIIADELKRNYSDETLRKFTEQYLFELLKDRDTLLENEDIICFQSIYRIFRGILEPDMEESVKFVINVIKNVDSDVGYLGFIEGVCSANLVESKEFNNFLNESLEELLKEIFRRSEQSIQYMVYDILYNYGKDELRNKYFKSNWENICASLHGKAELKRENVGEVYSDWGKVRMKFMYILKETSASVRKRNMFNNGAEKER